MTNIIYTMTQQSSTGITFAINGIQDNLGVWVTYDVIGSTGVLPSACRYYTWHCKTSSGYITLDSSNNMNPNVTIDYNELAQSMFNLNTFYEYFVLQQLLLKIDLVSRRYPQTFPKTFAISELMVFIEATIAEINLYPPLTRFWFRFSEYAKERDINFNPYKLNAGIPFEWVSLTTDGAMIQALTALGILETNINFNYSDQGINVQYNIVDPLNRWYESILKTYTDQRDRMKKNYFNMIATGTTPFAVGLPGIISAVTPSGASQVGYPWYRAYSIGRPM